MAALKSIKEYKNLIKGMKDLRVVTSGTTYITVQDKDGFKAYVQAETVSQKDDSALFTGIRFSTIHKSNKKTGGGRHISTQESLSDAQFEKHLRSAIEESRKAILSGKEKFV